MNPSRHHPRRRVIQYSETPTIESRSRGVLDPPLSRRMTTCLGAGVVREPDPRTPSRGEARSALIKPVKMMDRAMPMADTETIGRHDRRADPGLGIAHRGFQLLAFGEACRDRRGQRAAGAVGIPGGDAG